MQRQYGIVGRERELGTALAALAGGRHLLLEGPVGAGKTTVARAVCGHLQRETVRVDGDDRCTESRFAGWFDPPLRAAVRLPRRGLRRRAAGPRPARRLRPLPQRAEPPAGGGAEPAAAGARRGRAPGAAPRRGARRRGLSGGGDAEPGGIRRHRPPVRGRPRPVRAPRDRLPDRRRGGGHRRGGDLLPGRRTGARGREARAGDAAAPARAPRGVGARRDRDRGADASDGRRRARRRGRRRWAAPRRRRGARDPCGAARRRRRP